MHSFGQAIDELQSGLFKTQPVTYEECVWKASEIFAPPPPSALPVLSEKKSRPYAYNPYDKRQRHEWRAHSMKAASRLFPFLSLFAAGLGEKTPPSHVDPLIGVFVPWDITEGLNTSNPRHLAITAHHSRHTRRFHPSSNPSRT